MYIQPIANSGRSTGRWFRPVRVWLPTWRLLVPGVLLLSLLCFWVGRSLHGFLGVSQPVAANVLVVEGWSPDYALEWAVQEFDRGRYDLLVAAGGPMERGSLVSGFASYAEIAEATLSRLGVDPARLGAAPSEAAIRNRTFASARGVRKLLDGHELKVDGLNLITMGPHARRSWVVYKKALGDRYAVGILAVPPRDYDPARWWASSAGAKSTIVEALGWAYEALFDSGR
jgi:hypothetical protein